MTRPRPNMQTANRVSESVFTADGIHHGIGHFDIPGGCGVSPGYWKADYEEQANNKKQENRRREYNHILNLEKRLQAIHERLGIRETEVEHVKLEKSQERTNHDK